jgi:hypothetical protein
MDEAEIHQTLAQACCRPHAFDAFVVCPYGDLIPLDPDGELLVAHPHNAWLELPAAAHRHGMSFIEVAQLALATNPCGREGHAELQAVVDWMLLRDRLPVTVTGYRRRTGGSRHIHITPTEPVVHGALVRQPGELLCRRGHRRSHDPDPFGTIARLTARTAFAEPGCSPNHQAGYISHLGSVDPSCCVTAPPWSRSRIRLPACYCG